MDGPEVVHSQQADLEVAPPKSLQHHPQSGEPAGLEVAYPKASGLEVAYPRASGLEAHELPSEKTPRVTEAEEAALAASGRGAKGRLCGLRRREFWLVLLVLLLVIVAAVLGGVLGTQKSRAGHAASATESATPTATPTAVTTAPASVPTTIGAKSKLAVTGWRTGEEYSIQLFFQGPDDLLRYSVYESTSGSWAAPVVSVKAAPGSAIGVTAFSHSIYGGDDNMQVELFYLDESSYVREQASSPSGNLNGSLSSENYAASPSSQLSTYWPSLIYEGTDGSYYEVTYAGSITKNVWDAEVIAQPGALLNGSGLAELTTTPDYTSLGLFWQDASGDLILLERDSNTTAWTAGQTIASIPKGSSIGALYAPASSGNETNVYALWQDTNGDINVSDMKSGWSNSSKPDALKNADTGTSITCLTPVSFYNVSLGTTPSLARCYFRANGAVREVEVTGGKWQVLGYVPIP